MTATPFPTTAEISDHYQQVLALNDRQNICCNLAYPKDQIEKEIAGHSLSTLFPLSQIEIMPGRSILDIGCGAGADCFAAAKMTGVQSKIVGIDIVDALIQRALHLAAKYNYTNVQFLLNTEPRLPFSDETFDIATMNYSFHLVPDKQNMLGQIYRVLKSGGTVVVGDSFSPKPVRYSEDPDSWYLSAANAITFEEFEAASRDAGFSEISFKRISFPDMPESEVIGYAMCRKLSVQATFASTSSTD